MTATEIKQLYDRVAAQPRLTAADRQTIADAVTPYGVVIRSSRCRNCYTDALLEAYHLARRMEQAASNPADTDGGVVYVFKFRRPVMVNGRVFSSLTPVGVIQRLQRSDPALFRSLYHTQPLPATTADEAPATEDATTTAVEDAATTDTDNTDTPDANAAD